jgi:hypothetical protein
MSTIVGRCPLSIAVTAIAILAAASAQAGNISSSLPETGAKATANGANLKITNGADGSASATPVAIAGVALGKNGRAISGTAQGSGGAGIYGVNNATGAAGQFELMGAKASASDTALLAVNAASGPAASESQFGSAGVFKITNANNQSTALVVESTAGDGIDVNTKGGTAISAEGGTYAVYAESVANNSYGVYGFGESYGIYGHAEYGVAVFGNADSGGTAAEFRQSQGHCLYKGGIQWSCGVGQASIEDDRPVDGRAVLRRLAGMPVHDFRLRSYGDPQARWIGPNAEDFNAAFPLHQQADEINAGNEMGAALAAIQGLYAELRDRDAKIAGLEARLTKLEAAAAAAGGGGPQAAR